MFAPSARAQAEPIALVWDAPAACSSARDVLARVRRLTRAARLPARQLEAEAVILPRHHGKLHLKLVVRAGGLVGERAIDGRTCDDLAGATAVVLALLVSSEEPLREGELDGSAHTNSQLDAPPTSGPAEDNSPSEAELATDDSEPVPVPAQATEVEARRPRRWRGVLGLPVGSLGIGPLPGLSLGVFVAAGLELGRYRLVAEGGAWLRQALQSASEPDAGATVHRVEGALRGSRAFSLGPWEVAPSVRVAVQHLWARGTGVHVAAQTAKATWVAVGLGLQAGYRLTQWFRVFAGLDGHVQTARPRLSIDEVGKLYQLRRAAFTVTFGSAWIF